MVFSLARASMFASYLVYHIHAVPFISLLHMYGIFLASLGLSSSLLTMYFSRYLSVYIVLPLFYSYVCSQGAPAAEGQRELLPPALRQRGRGEAAFVRLREQVWVFFLCTLFTTPTPKIAFSGH